MEKYFTAVIGGGAAGICAAISSARNGHSVVICEKLAQTGKKVLASGNGRCNLLNDNLDVYNYNTDSHELVLSIFAKFGQTEILNLFHRLGLETYSQDGRIFPLTNQAASVLKVLEIELRRLAIPIVYGFDCTDIQVAKNNIVVTAKDGKKVNCEKVVITGGGKAYPVLGSDGSTLEIAHKLGHTIVEPVPCAVPLVVKDHLCHLLQGQRINAAASSVVDGIKSPEVQGELLFTKYGLSGTCILDISEEISIAFNRQHKNDVFVSVDMIPFWERQVFKEAIYIRRKAGFISEEILVGLLPNKLSFALKDILENNDADTIFNTLKDYRFKVSETKSWNEAEFTAGGINVNEIKPGTLESRLQPGVYFAGEVLDVNGRRGGYNLAWAWASGYIAGQSL
jgi:predicted Rossmann fold flavoprotein